MKTLNKVSEPSHPAFHSFEQVIPLSGFSGAAIALLRSKKGEQIVRKASNSSLGNEALQQQCRRQAWLKDRLDGIAHVPEILQEGTVNGLYYFDMAFVPSSDANVFLSRASLVQVKLFAERVEEMMRRISITHDPDAAAPNYEALLNKVAEIDRKTGAEFAHLLQPLHEGFSRLQASAIKLEATIVHGDLTFENILVDSSHRLWLIDSIRPPIDHYWLDWSKLFQECEGFWHRHRGNSLSSGSITWLRKRWMRVACATAPDYAKHHYLLLALTFARILPYTKTNQDVAFVTERVARFGQAAQNSVTE